MDSISKASKKFTRSFTSANFGTKNGPNNIENTRRSSLMSIFKSNSVNTLIEESEKPIIIEFNVDQWNGLLQIAEKISGKSFQSYKDYWGDPLIIEYVQKWYDEWHKSRGGKQYIVTFDKSDLDNK